MKEAVSETSMVKDEEVVQVGYGFRGRGIRETGDGLASATVATESGWIRLMSGLLVG